MHGHKLKHVDSIKYLGLTVSKDKHVDLWLQRQPKARNSSVETSELTTNVCAGIQVSRPPSAGIQFYSLGPLYPRRAPN